MAIQLVESDIQQVKFDKKKAIKKAKSINIRKGIVYGKASYGKASYRKASFRKASYGKVSYTKAS